MYVYDALGDIIKMLFLLFRIQEYVGRTCVEIEKGGKKERLFDYKCNLENTNSM